MTEIAIRHWREDPVRFVVDCFGVQPDAWQAKVLKEFPKSQRTALLACKGPGKSTVLSWLSWNFLATRPHPKIAATSITGPNLQDCLWAEMSKWAERSEFLKAAFVITDKRIFNKENPKTWWMSARTWVKGSDSSQQANTLAGLHAEHLLFVLDEVGGIPDSVMATAEAGLASGIETKILMAGNPTHTEGPLYRAATSERHLWNLTEITADPDDPNRTPRVSKAWAREQIDKYGKDNPWVLVNVFGRFPPASINSLLGPSEVSEAMKRHYTPDQFELSQKRLGVDVSRFGDDRTVIFPRQGLASFKPVEMRNARTNEIAARIMMAKSKWRSELEFIDDTGGWGAGVIDSLIQAGQSPLGINFSGKAEDARYLNKRAEMWFRMQDWVKRGGALPNIPSLVSELTTTTYTFHNGKFTIEPKEQIKARLGFSPDLADALALTFALPEMPASNLFPGMEPTSKHLSDYDPYDPTRM